MQEMENWTLLGSPAHVFPPGAPSPTRISTVSWPNEMVLLDGTARTFDPPSHIWHTATLPSHVDVMGGTDPHGLTANTESGVKTRVVLG